MRIISRPRGGGKTTELIRISAENFSYIVVDSRRRAAAVFHQAKDMGLDIPFPITYDELINGDFYGKGIAAFLIDDIDQLVQRLARGVPVRAITITEAKISDES